MRVPDYLEPLVGLRQWEFDAEAGTLDSPLSRIPATAWDGGAVTASCKRADHSAPQANCQCGLYSVNGFRHLPQNHRHPGEWVVGMVEQWGTVELHPTGMRSEYARVVALLDPKDSHKIGPQPWHRTLRWGATLMLLGMVSLLGIIYLQQTLGALMLGVTLPVWAALGIFGCFFWKDERYRKKTETRHQASFERERKRLQAIYQGVPAWAEAQAVPVLGWKAFRKLYHCRSRQPTYDSVASQDTAR